MKPETIQEVLQAKRRWTAVPGDNREALKLLPDGCIDSVVCDPPYELTSETAAGRRYCLSGILLDVVLPQLQHSNPELFRDQELSLPSSGVPLLDGTDRSSGVVARVAMPESSLDLQGNMLKKQKVKGAGDTPQLVPNDVLPGEGYSKPDQLQGDYILQPGDMGDATICNGSCSCYGEVSPDLVCMVVSLPAGTLCGCGSPGSSSCLSDLIGATNNARDDSGRPSGIVAGSRAEDRAVLTLDLGRSTGELAPTSSTTHRFSLRHFLRPQAVRAGTATGGLPSEFQPFRVRLVGVSAHRTVTVYLHRDIVRRLARKGKGGFMGRTWDASGIAYNVPLWKEVLRVLKPGGYLMAFGGCYDDQTEVLTSRGWVRFPDVTLTDEFASLNPETHEIDFQAASALIAQPHFGPMHHYVTNRVDLLVTPNHSMLVSPLGKTRFKLVTSDTIGRAVRMTKTSQGRVDTTPEPFRLPAATRKVGYGHGKPLPEKLIPQKVWSALFGFWLAQGSASKVKVAKGHGYNVSFSHFKEHDLRELAALVDPYFKMLVYAKHGKARINDVQLTEYLLRFGHAGDKFIPDEVKRYPPEALRLLISWFCRGDGDRAEGRRLYTGSKRLRDDLQEVAMYAGWAVDWTEREKRPAKIADQEIHATLPEFVLGLLKHQTQPEVYERKRGAVRTEVSAEAWAGRAVYCVELPLHHTLYVRRNGKAVWCGNSRTYHRMACAIEDAGFEVRDSLHWVYGQGMPHGMNIGKAIDKAQGVEPEVVGEREGHVFAHNKGSMMSSTTSETGQNERGAVPITKAVTELGKKWEGWHTQLKPSHEPVVMARKPLEGSIVENTLRYGTGGLNVGAARVGNEERFNAPAATSGRVCFLAPANLTGYEGQACVGRWPSNLILSHSDYCTPLGTKKIRSAPTHEHTPDRGQGNTYNLKREGGTVQGYGGEDGMEEIEEWDCHPSCPVRLLDRQAIANESAGSVSRYFTVIEPDCPFVYEPKPSEQEKSLGTSDLYWKVDESKPSGVVPISKIEWYMLVSQEKRQLRASNQAETPSTNPFTPRKIQRLQMQGNIHTTIKPIGVMGHLIKLVTPPGGVVLDLFAGSFTTGIAAITAGWRFIGLDLEPDHVRIGEARLSYWHRYYRPEPPKGAKKEP